MNSLFFFRSSILKALLLIEVLLLVLFFVNYDRFKDIIVVQKINDNTISLSENPDYSQLQNEDFELPDTIIEIMKMELSDYKNWCEALHMDEIYNLTHETVFAKEISSIGLSEESLVVVVFSNTGGNFCGACCGVISFFEFQIVNEQCQLNRKSLAFYNGSDEGMPPNNISLERIGKSKYGIIITNYFSGTGGHEYEYTSMHIPFDDSIKTVLEFTSYEYYFDPPADMEYKDGNVIMRVVQSNNEFFDIETESESDSEVKWYKFDGNNYVESTRK